MTTGGRGGWRPVISPWRCPTPYVLVAVVLATVVAAALPAAADDGDADAGGNVRVGPVEDLSVYEPRGPSTAAVEVDDDLRDAQWYLDRIRIPEAWETTRGDEGVTVAVIDTGVDPHHRDLSGAFWSDPQTGTAGYDHVEDTEETYVGPLEDWHGTAVAGVVAARADDGYGMAGVAPQVQLMVHRVYRSTSSSQPPNEASYDDAITAIRAAVTSGADVVLLTWGGVTPRAELFRTIRDAGVPVVAAAGNDGQNLSELPDPIRYPAAYRAPNLVTVAATGHDDRLLSSPEGVISNYGQRHVDLAAPGQEIATLTAGGSHELFAGTSFAAPQVAGALALARSAYPEVSTNELVGTLTRTVRPTRGLRGRVTSGGVLDVEAFLWASQRPACGEDADIDPVAFDDLDADNLHGDDIACVVAYGISNGIDDDRYAPQRTISRAEMAAFLVRTIRAAGGSIPEDPDSPFTDTEDSVHAEDIDALAMLGITSGVSDDAFDPTGTVTRAQMAAFVVRTVELLLDTDLDGERPWFDDVDGHTHEDPIVVARDLGITLGGADPREFAPERGISRAQMASFVARTLDTLERAGLTVERPS